jgi:DNA-binding protein H-NS
MNTQTEITIKVSSDIAEAYNQANEEEKQELINKIAFFLQPIATDKQQAIKQLRQTLSEIGKQAQARGLTPEILINILNEELDKKRQQASLKLSVTMDKASDEAEANGLTPEILEEITTEQIIDLANSSSAFNFLNNEPEIYTLEDGEAI